MSAAAEEFQPEAVPEHCPGPEKEGAGKATPCQGCPNQSICASGAGAAGPDPAIEEIRERLINVKHKILILSGKGGVGKSSLTVMLARALSRLDAARAAGEGEGQEPGSEVKGQEVGLVDIDICGPSLPRMLGVEGEEVHQSMEGWSPVQVDENLCLMSIAFLLGGPDDAVVWRGPRKNGMIKQFLRDVNWGSLDWMLVDTPPGTSDEHLSLVSYLSSATGVDGAIIIGTPQDVALLDVRKEVTFCRKVGIPLLGLVENMAGFTCPNCHRDSDIFLPSAETGGVEGLCGELGVPFLGRVPLDPRLARCCDEGTDFLDEFAGSPAALAYMDLAKRLSRSST